jgi:hypothetical protein
MWGSKQYLTLWCHNDLADDCVEIKSQLNIEKGVVGIDAQPNK